MEPASRGRQEEEAGTYESDFESSAENDDAQLRTVVDGGPPFHIQQEVGFLALGSGLTIRAPSMAALPCIANRWLGVRVGCSIEESRGRGAGAMAVRGAAG